MNQGYQFRFISIIWVALFSASCSGQMLARNGPPSQPTSDSDGSTLIEPALRSAFVSNRQPVKREPLLRSLLGPRADVGFFTVGNFNSTSYIRLLRADQQVISSNKSSVGGGAEYRWRLSDHNALGLLYVQNPSDGKLWVSSSPGSTQTYVWPLMRYDLSILATQSFRVKRLAPFLSEGPGVVVTNGYDNSGWSAGFAFVAGLGADYQLTPSLSARTGITFLNTKGGCYDDPTCSETWGVAEDLRIGFVYKWGARAPGSAIK